MTASGAFFVAVRLGLTDGPTNDRFKLHREHFILASVFIRTHFIVEPVYRLAEKEWKDFIESFTDVLVEADPQIPHLPPKDVSHRIYRDVCIVQWLQRASLKNTAAGSVQQ
jgi:hypothetical protein